MLCNAILKCARLKKPSCQSDPQTTIFLRLPPLFSLHLSFCSLTRMPDYFVKNLRAIRGNLCGFVLFGNFRSVYLRDVRVLREISEMPREKEGILFENSRENVYPSKFMRILNPLMPREVCPFQRGRLRPREFRSRSLCVSRVLANFSMSFHNSILVARTFLVKSVRFFFF